MILLDMRFKITLHKMGLYDYKYTGFWDPNANGGDGMEFWQEWRG